MRTFTDANGKTWELSINVGTYQDVRANLKIDLTKLIHDKCRGLQELFEDLGKLVDVLYVLCIRQCEERGITDEQFGRSFNGDTIEQATAAFLEELADFFPNRKVRETFRDLLAKNRQATEELERRLEKEAAAVTPATLIKAMEAEAEKLTGSLTVAPASSAAIPDQ